MLITSHKSLFYWLQEKKIIPHLNPGLSNNQNKFSLTARKKKSRCIQSPAVVMT